MSKYLLKPELKTIKQGFVLEDENSNVVYSAKMLKFSLLGASPFEFINHLTNKKEEHKIGKTITSEESGLASFFSTTFKSPSGLKSSNTSFCIFFSIMTFPKVSYSHISSICSAEHALIFCPM